MPPHNPGKDRATFTDFLQILRLRKTLVLFLMGLVFVTTLGVTALQPRWYLSTALIRVEKPEGEVKLFQTPNTTYADPSFLQDQFRILQSEKILYPVISNLGLTERLAAELGARSALPVTIAYHYLTEKMLRIESQRNSSIIEINVYARDPALAASIANEITSVYSTDRIELATSEQSSGLSKLRSELDTEEKEVSRQRDVVEKLRKDLNISGVDLNTRYSDMEIDRLRQLQNSLIALRVDAIGRKTRWESFKAIPPEQRVSLVNSELIQDANIQSLLQAYLVADQTVSRLRARLGPAHPDLVVAVDSRTKIRQQLDAQLTGYEHALEISYQESHARVTELESELAKAKVDQILSARERLRPFEEAVQKFDDESRMLTTLKVTLRQREIDFQVPKKTIEVLDVAAPALAPSKPNWMLNIGLSLLFGLVLGVGSAVGMEYFDTSFRNVGDVESKLRLPALGILPLSGEDDVLEDSAEAEPYRLLHTNLNLALTAGKGHALMICSAGPGEGKSTTLCNLARLMAQSGERVLLIDSDLRRPVQHRLLSRPRAPGLVQALKGERSLEDTIQKDIRPGLDFLPSGAADGFVLGLLQLPRLRQIVAELRGRYDKVLFDSPPVIGVSDASVLANAVDGALLLIQHRRNPESMVIRAKQILDDLKVPVLGVVLNQVPENAGYDYAYYTRNYAYYGEGGGPKRRRQRDSARCGDSAQAPLDPDRIDLREGRETPGKNAK